LAAPSGGEARRGPLSCGLASQVAARCRPSLLAALEAPAAAAAVEAAAAAPLALALQSLRGCSRAPHGLNTAWQILPSLLGGRTQAALVLSSSGSSPCCVTLTTRATVRLLASIPFGSFVRAAPAHFVEGLLVQTPGQRACRLPAAVTSGWQPTGKAAGPRCSTCHLALLDTVTSSDRRGQPWSHQGFCFSQHGLHGEVVSCGERDSILCVV